MLRYVDDGASKRWPFFFLSHTHTEHIGQHWVRMSAYATSHGLYMCYTDGRERLSATIFLQVKCMRTVRDVRSLIRRRRKRGCDTGPWFQSCSIFFQVYIAEHSVRVRLFPSTGTTTKKRKETEHELFDRSIDRSFYWLGKCPSPI